MIYNNTLKVSLAFSPIFHPRSPYRQQILSNYQSINARFQRARSSSSSALLFP